MKIKYLQLPAQEEFDNDVTTFLLLMLSGFGGGKSYALAMKLFKLSQLNAPYPGALFVPSIPEYKRDMLPIMLEILEENRINFDYNKSEFRWTLPWTRGPLYTITCERRIRGPNLAYGGINEPALISYERFKEAIGRIRIGKAKNRQLALAGTGERKSDWLYEHFVEKGIGRIIHADTRKNIFLSDDYVPNLIENYDEQWLEAYLKGGFVNFNTSAFYYAFDRTTHLDKTIEYDPNLEVHIGMDFNVDYMTCTLWHADDKTARCFDEIVLPQNQRTQKICDAILARKYKVEMCTVYPDTAGKHRDTRSTTTDIIIVKENGFKVRYKKRAPYFRDRQLCVNNLLDKKRLKVHPKCKVLIRDLSDVEQDRGDLSKIKTNPKLTHASDGMDYMLDILFPLSGRKPISTTSR